MVPNDFPYPGGSWIKKVVIWPDSRQWETLLRGQLVTFFDEGIWDSETGDVDEAVSVGLQIIERNNATGELPMSLPESARWLVQTGFSVPSFISTFEGPSTQWETVLSLAIPAADGDLVSLNAIAQGHHLTPANPVSWQARLVLAGQGAGEQSVWPIGFCFRNPGHNDISSMCRQVFVIAGGSLEAELQVWCNQPELAFQDAPSRPTSVSWAIFR